MADRTKLEMLVPSSFEDLQIWETLMVRCSQPVATRMIAALRNAQLRTMSPEDERALALLIVFFQEAYAQVT